MLHACMSYGASAWALPHLPLLPGRSIGRFSGTVPLVTSGSLSRTAWYGRLGAPLPAPAPRLGWTRALRDARMQGTTALIGTEGGTVHMFSLMDGSQELRMCANNERITALAVAWYVSGALSSPVAASACSSGVVHVWDLMGESEDLPICTLNGHNGAVPGVTFFRRGERLATASHDGTAAVWDVVSGSRVGVLSRHSGRVNHIEVEPLREDLLLTCSDDGLAAVWHSDSCTLAALLQGHESFVTVANFVPSGDRGDEAHRTFAATASGDGTVAVWDALSGERIQVRPRPPCCSGPLTSPAAQRMKRPADAARLRRPPLRALHRLSRVLVEAALLSRQCGALVATGPAALIGTPPPRCHAPAAKEVRGRARPACRS